MGISNQETLFISKFGHEKNLGYEATIDNIDNHHPQDGSADAGTSPRQR